jgi:glyoxylase-like metal-dependent hydrolase (beta-lactamase superfamily II)
MGIEIKCYPDGMYGENTYLITDDATGYKAIIDPGYYGVDVRMDIQNNAYLKYVLLTHGHDDHFLAANDYLEQYSSVKFAVPEKDIPVINVQRFPCPKPGLLLHDGDVITLGETELRVIETPGHTAGGICFATDKEIFTGDTLFRLSVGRTDLPTGDWFTLLHSINDKLYTLDEDMIVYPGHGAPTTIGYEKRANPFV